MIDRLFTIESADCFRVLAQEFDYLYSLDKDLRAAALAMQVKAHHRKGYALSPWGTLDIFNDSSQYALLLGLDDNLKFFNNLKTYQETIYQIAELSYERDPYVYKCDPVSLQKAKKIIDELKIPGSGPKIGLNTGCGSVFATKKWPSSHFKLLAERLRKSLDARIFLLGGEKEQLENETIANEFTGEIANTKSHSLDVFAGLLHEMDCIVTSDSMALHLALAVRTQTIALFGPTCAQEIDFYDNGQALIAKRECCPCYRSHCLFETSCMAELTPEMVENAILEGFKRHRRSR